MEIKLYFYFILVIGELIYDFIEKKFKIKKSVIKPMQVILRRLLSKLC